MSSSDASERRPHVVFASPMRVYIPRCDGRICAFKDDAYAVAATHMLATRCLEYTDCGGREVDLGALAIEYRRKGARLARFLEFVDRRAAEKEQG